MTDDRLFLPSYEQLEGVDTIREGMPTIDEGWSGDLKVDTEDFRLWVSRCGVEDGEPFPHTIYVEAFNIQHGRWEDLGHYDGDDPPHSLPGLTPHAFRGEV